MAERKPSSAIDSAVPTDALPTLSTTASSRPHCSTHAPIGRSTAGESVTSMGQDIQRDGCPRRGSTQGPARERSRMVAIVVTPARVAAMADATPMPDGVPEIRTVWGGWGNVAR